MTPPSAAAQMLTPKQQFLDAYAKEHATTLRVLNAFPEGKEDLKPNARLKTARELAWIFVTEQGMAAKALTTGFDWSTPPAPAPEPPETIAEIIDALEESHDRVADLVGGKSDEEMHGTVKFFTGPGKIEDIPLISFLWFMLCDQIHHRGQFSIYLRLADAKVPSIYGPSGDEPWF